MFRRILYSVLISALLVAPLYSGQLLADSVQFNVGLTIVPDTVAEEPRFVSFTPNETNLNWILKIQTEPNSTIEIKMDDLHRSSFVTDAEGFGITELSLFADRHELALRATDYSGNLSKWVTLTVDRHQGFISVSDQDDIEYEFEDLSSRLDEIYEIPKVTAPSGIVTIQEKDFYADSDNDHITDAYEIFSGESPDVPDDLFKDPWEVSHVQEAIFTEPEFFMYGSAPANQTIATNLIHSNESTIYHLWEGHVDESGTFLVDVPFYEEGDFTLQVQGFENGEVVYEEEKAVVTFDLEREPIPIAVNLHYNVGHSTGLTSTLSLDTDTLHADLLGPAVDLKLIGQTHPLHEVFVVWDGEVDWFVQALSHPDTGYFELAAPDSISQGDHTVYIYSRDLETHQLSDVIQTNLTVNPIGNPLMEIVSRIWLQLAALVLLSLVMALFFVFVNRVHRQRTTPQSL